MAGSPGSVLEELWVPEELSAREPAEVRGRGRDDVRLMVSHGARVSHHGFRELPALLRAGDVLVVNTSPTLPAAVNGRLGGDAVVVHFSTRGDDGRWAVELRDPDGSGSTRPRPGGPVGAVVRLPGGGWLVIEEPLVPGAERLWWASVSVPEGAGTRAGPGSPVARYAPGTAEGVGTAEGPEGVPGLLRRHGRPIRYAYTVRDQPLSAYQTVFALPSPDGSGSAEMPSAARPFTARLVAELVSRGVQFAPVVLHTGVASAEAHEPPYPERFEVPAATAWLVNAARAGGGRIVAVGTTAVRALESAAGPDGAVRAAAGWTGLVVTPERGVHAVDGLLTGLHEPAASHLLMLEAIAGRAAVGRAYEAALRRLYLWHEFGDLHLVLPDENTHALNC
ncbi:S-adenosylmethionine:tRNA ribosyltransferase-isomerase [Streptomyces sp. NPDC051018]|uniref:S-adenosylmethionine:tRNA ribosyltransferase-isomerase n=1 Tax=Streptomyces sp. NPDC051018 TaxID=3365639 RepID=UPI0037A4BFB2